MNANGIGSATANLNPFADPDQAQLRTAAREFEALLIEAMFRSMRSAIQEEEPEAGYGKDILQDLVYQGLARSISQGTGLGVARLLERGVTSGRDELPAEGRQSVSPRRESFELPVAAVVSSPFGWREDPLTGNRRYHRGVDFAAPNGTPVVAAQEGKVVHSGQGPQYGQFVVIEHGEGYRTLYAHLSAREVAEGDVVTSRQVIGRVGSTGRSTGPHLHFEVQKPEGLVDPVSAVRRTDTAGLETTVKGDSE